MGFHFKKFVTSTFLAAALLAASFGGPETASGERLSLGYLFFGTQDAYIRQVNAAGASLNRVSPTLFDLSAAGELVIGADIGELVSAMKERSIKVVPFISNHWDRNGGRLALANREALASSIADAVNRYRLDGVNVDIENLTEQDKAAFTDLVRLLRQKLPQGAEISVAIAANPDGWTQGWEASYDLAALSGYSDYLMLMAYDEHWEGDEEAGPVASLPWVEKSVQQALKLVPAEKLVLGVPFYGRYWKDGGGVTGAGIPNETAEKLLQRYGLTPTYDEQKQAAFYRFTVGPNEANPPEVNGKAVAPGTYTVWFDNERSMKRKLDLVNKYNLKGAGAWCLSQESPGTWTYYASWLNDSYFADADGHWAEDEIRHAADEGWMTGTGSLTFGPDRPLTRAQAAAILVRASGLSAGLQSGSGGQADSPFRDVPSAYWGAAEIGLARSQGWIDGFADGTFAPEKPVSREQLAAMLYRATGEAGKTGSPGNAGGGSSAVPSSFTDVAQVRWSWTAVSALQRLGLLQGYADGSFRPEATVTRAEAAVLLQRSSSRLAAGIR